MAENLNVKGLKELDKFLKELPVKFERNIKRAGLRQAGNVYKEAAKNGIKSISGDLARSVRVTSRINKKKGTIDAAVKAGVSRKHKNAFTAPFVEFGTKPHFIKVQESEKQINYRLSRKRGTVVRESLTTINRNSLKIGSKFVGPTVSHPGSDPHPFMRPAFDSKSQEAIKAFGEHVKKKLRTKHGINTKDISIGFDEE